ncbi:unnamed protein product [Auanema sp. JU1783]|nr:unnamed protein product [Auanema sp. JU1783]
MDSKRTWDLDAIVTSINNATTTLDIHVMDYFPAFIYKKPSEYFPVIDNAIRNAIIRKVKIRIITSALHYPELGIRYMKSLQSLNGAKDYNIQIRIITIPRTHLNGLLSRERRSHIKFLVTDRTVVIGTSNWSGDYFTGGTTGEAVVVNQNKQKKTIVHQMKKIFDRDWNGPYSHNLEDYYENCVLRRTAIFCEVDKD